MKKFEFRFPTTMIDLEEVSGKEELSELLKDHLKQSEMSDYRFQYRLALKKNQYLYATCSNYGCKSHLRYRQAPGGCFQLIRAETHHIHDAPKAKVHRFAAAINYIQSFPLTVPVCSLKAVVCREFSLSDKQFYYLLKKCRHVRMDIP